MNNSIKRKLAHIQQSIQVLPVLAAMTAEAEGSAEIFCQVALVALWQLDNAMPYDLQGIRWHGKMEPWRDGLLFSSLLILPAGKRAVKTDTIVDFLGTDIITNSVYKGRLWKISCHLPIVPGQALIFRERDSFWEGLYGVLTMIRDLKRDMAAMTQEMFMTNQGVMAMVEEMGLWMDGNGGQQNVSKLLTERLESNRQLLQRLQEKEQALQQAERLATIGRLVAGVAHEINNPLTFIKMNAELLQITLNRHYAQDKAGMNSDLPYKRPIEAILRGVDRIAHIVSGLKFFSRQTQREKTGVTVGTCLEDAWTLVQSNKELSSGVEIITSIQPTMMIYGNAQQLEQVLINLLHNALKAIQKASPEQGMIHVNAYQERTDKDWIVIRIEDNGCGIQQSAIAKIFEPFYTSDDENGTGLGLSIVQGIIQEHAGNIGVMSVVGQGTIFTIRLPSWQLQESDE